MIDMNTDIKKDKTGNKIWMFSPLIVVLLAIVILIISSGPGLDGAARSTLVVFWFMPTIIYTGIKSIIELNLTQIKVGKKILIISIWVIPSLPLCMMSLYGILLMQETGIAVIFR